MKSFKSAVIIVKQLLTVLNKEQKIGSVWVFFSMIVCSVLELIGVSAIYPFLQTIIYSDNINDKWYVKVLARNNIQYSQKTLIIIIGLLIIALYIVKNAMSLFCSYVQYKYVNKFQREISTLMLESYLRRPYEFFINNNSSIMIRGIENDTMATYYILMDVFQIIAEVLTTILIACYLLLTDWIISIGALLIAFCCFLALVLGLKKRINHAGKAAHEASAYKYQNSYQAITGAKEIAVLGRQKIFLEKYEEIAKRYEKANLLNCMLTTSPNRIIEGVCVAGFMAIVCIRIGFIDDINSFIPTLGAFAMGTFKILPSVAKISASTNSIIYRQFGLANCYDNILEARKSENDFVNDDGRKGENTTCCNSDIAIKLDNIFWKYSSADEYTLSGLSLSVNRGESVALIGASGAGKTTTVDIMLGLLNPQMGTIEIDGVNVLSIKAEMKKHIGYVPQTVFLIDDTLRANVAFGLSGDLIDEERVNKSLEQAQLLTFVESLPDGLDTIVGERGVKLSGGQRQRIAIARALYENPDIIILDEATSSLDTGTESAVMAAIESLHGKKTLIIVAHRMSTIANCDKIYEVENGVAVLRDYKDIYN